MYYEKYHLDVRKKSSEGLFVKRFSTWVTYFSSFCTFLSNIFKHFYQENYCKMPETNLYIKLTQKLVKLTLLIVTPFGR